MVVVDRERSRPEKRLRVGVRRSGRRGAGPSSARRGSSRSQSPTMSKRTIASISSSGGTPCPPAVRGLLDVLLAAARAVHRRTRASPRASSASKRAIATPGPASGSAGSGPARARPPRPRRRRWRRRSRGCPWCRSGRRRRRSPAPSPGSCRRRCAVRALDRRRPRPRPRSARRPGARPARRSPPSPTGAGRARPGLEVGEARSASKPRRRPAASSRSSRRRPRSRRSEAPRPADRSEAIGAARAHARYVRAHGPGAHGPADLDRRLVPDERVGDEPHAHRRRDGLRGPAAELRRSARPHREPPRTSSPATGRSSPAPPVETGRPFWVDDPQFNLSYHVRHSALPPPGGEDELRRMAARVFSQQLDRTKPLWELWLVEGLRKKRFALISKTHHALVDGVSGVDIATVLFDFKPVPEPVEPTRRLDPAARALGREPRGPRRSRALAKTPLGAGARRRQGASRSPGVDRCGEVQQAAEGARRGRLGVRQPGARRAAEHADRPAPPLRLGARRPRRVQADQVGARRHRQRRRPRPPSPARCARWLRARGIRTEGLELRALVPVSIRAEDQHGKLGNQIAAVRGPLPVYVEDPVAAAAHRARGDGRDQVARRRRSAPR